MSKIIVAYVAECNTSFASAAPESMGKWEQDGKNFVGMKIFDGEIFNLSTINLDLVNEQFEDYKNIVTEFSGNKEWMAEFEKMTPTLLVFSE